MIKLKRWGLFAPIYWGLFAAIYWGLFQAIKWGLIERNFHAERLFILSPNPAYKEVFVNILIKAPLPGYIEIMNCFGEKMDFREISSGTLSFPINLERYKSGIYFVSLKANGKSETQKLVIVY